MRTCWLGSAWPVLMCLFLCTPHQVPPTIDECCGVQAAQPSHDDFPCSTCGGDVLMPKHRLLVVCEFVASSCAYLYIVGWCRCTCQQRTSAMLQVPAVSAAYILHEYSTADAYGHVIAAPQTGTVRDSHYWALVPHRPHWS